jgi:hypothetical protein
MAVELEVTFRGMFHLALPPPGERNRARILMPRNDVPRVAKGNERYTIPPYQSYVAIPVSANPTVAPDLVCELPVEHGETFNGRSAAARDMLPVEAVTRAKRREVVRDRPLVEPETKTYAIYFAKGCEMVVDALNGVSPPRLQYDSTPVGDTQVPNAGERSVYWLTPMRGANEGVLANLVTGTPPPATASFIDLTNGSMRPRGLLPLHHFRYLHSSGDAFRRPIAQELLVTADAADQTRITLRSFGSGDNVEITFGPQAGDRVIIGCEPLDDILGIASVQSCVEPAYDIELLYDLVGGIVDTVPVPLCSDNVDHRSPPGAACGPPTGGP